jgi:hypothetical protein
MATQLKCLELMAEKGVHLCIYRVIICIDQVRWPRPITDHIGGGDSCQPARMKGTVKHLDGIAINSQGLEQASARVRQPSIFNPLTVHSVIPKPVALYVLLCSRVIGMDVEISHRGGLVDALLCCCGFSDI